jgi:hypothetical protein
MRRITITFILLLPSLVACATSNPKSPKYRSNSASDATENKPAPIWLGQAEPITDQLCGYGIAGASFHEESPYPRQQAEDRAIKNLAGVLGTRVQEAIVDNQSNHSQRISYARVLTIDDALLQQVKELATTEFWLDNRGIGPFGEKGFTYAYTCVDVKTIAKKLNVDLGEKNAMEGVSNLDITHRPAWLENYGVQPDGRLCTVGFSLPTFHTEQTYGNVVEDVRVQLAKVIQTLVSSYYEERTTNRYQSLEAMTVATTEAVSKGVVVTHYWYDKLGKGPRGTKRSTYGYGCVYPMDLLLESVAKSQEASPEIDHDIVERVKKNANQAFDALDREIEKRHARTTAED